MWKRNKADKHDRHGKHSSKKASKQVRKQTSKKENKRCCPWGTNVGLDWMSITSLCWSKEDTLASKTHAWTCEQACKDVYGGTNKHGKHIIARSEKRKRYTRSNRHNGDVSQMVTFEQGFMGIGCNHTTTNPLRASSVAKPRTREASTSIKHKQA